MKKPKLPTRRERMLKRHLDEAIDLNRNAAQALVAARAERDLARVERGNAEVESADLRQQVGSLKEANDHLAGVNLAEIERRQKHQRRLFRIIYDLNLKVAKQEGYISRVTELDDPARSRVEPEQDATIAEIRERLMGAISENERDRIIESVDGETLDQVLGAPDDPFVRP